MGSRDRIGGLIMLAFSLAYGLMALALDSSAGLAAGGFSPRTLPLILAASGALLALLLILRPPPGTAEAPPALQLRHLNWRPALLLCAVMLVYAAIFPYLGFILSTVIFLSAAMVVLGIRSPRLLLLAVLPVTLLLWLVLSRLLGIYLAPGELLLLLAAQ